MLSNWRLHVALEINHAQCMIAGICDPHPFRRAHHNIVWCMQSSIFATPIEKARNTTSGQGRHHAVDIDETNAVVAGIGDNQGVCAGHSGNARRLAELRQFCVAIDKSRLGRSCARSALLGIKIYFRGRVSLSFCPDFRAKKTIIGKLPANVVTCCAGEMSRRA